MTRAGGMSRLMKGRASVITALALTSVVGHAVVLAMVGVDTPSFGGALPGTGERQVDLELSCESDMVLLAGARMSACSSPFASADPQVCASSALDQLSLDLIRCKEVPEMAGIELVDISTLDMQPEPLLPEVEPQDEIEAAQLIEEELAEKIEKAQEEVSKAKPAGQVVEITKPTLEMAPDNARYVSEYDSKVDKQTVARGSTEDMVERPTPPEQTEPPEQLTKADPNASQLTAAEPAEPKPGQGSGDEPSLLSMRGTGESEAPPEPTELGQAEGETNITDNGYAMRFGDSLTRRRPSEEPGSDSTEPGGGGGGPSKPINLRPTEEVLERVAGGGSVDHLDDAEQGDFTALNSRKWKYASFFNRLKRDVAQNWHPDVVYLRRDPQGNIYGTKDRLTVLRVTLKPDGSVDDIYVAKQSGVDFLDDEAVRAFREAQPFVNPPTGLVDARSGRISFSFGFHFQIGGNRSRWKVFRYQ